MTTALETLIAVLENAQLLPAGDRGRELAAAARAERDELVAALREIFIDHELLRQGTGKELLSPGNAKRVNELLSRYT